VRTGLSVFLIFGGIALGGDTQMLFNPGKADVGPFPSDMLTVADSQQKTGRRVNLPVQNCEAAPTACSDATMLNQLDGFSVEPRIRLCFSQPVTASTIADGVFLVGLHRLTQIIRVGRVFVDPTTNCAAVKPESILEPGRQYAMFVTDSIRDAAGTPVTPSSEFKNSLKLGLGSYGYAVDSLLNLVNSLFGQHIVGASLFTTMSATQWIQQARAFVNSSQSPVIVRQLEKFELSSRKLTSFQWVPDNPISGFPSVIDLPVDLPGIGNVLFGLYYSPNFIATDGVLAGSIPQTPTGQAIVFPKTPVVDKKNPGFVPISFHAFLPSSPQPEKGFPVAIFGHGLTDFQFGASTTIASTLAQAGIATIAMEITGHGFGPASKVQLGTRDGKTKEIATPGRGILLPDQTQIGPVDGCILPGPLAARDCARQTAVDIFALVRAIAESSELSKQFDPSRIFFIGQSFGSIYGSFVTSSEPRIRAAVLNVPAGSAVDTVRLAQDRQLAIMYLGLREPSLLNLPYGSPLPMRYDFNDNFVYRGKQPLVNDVPGAPEIQAAFEVAEWLNMPGGPLAFGAGLKRAPVLFQFAKGDEEVPNPTNSAIIRAAGGQSTSRYLRFDLAKDIAASQLPVQPHRFLANPDIFSTPAQLSIALAAQQQVAGFLSTNGSVIPDANQALQAPFVGVKLFETPSVLPEDLNFVRQPATPPPAP
jgi:dienelactone hydrolase